MPARTAGEGRYARVEREQRWLDTLAASLAEHGVDPAGPAGAVRR
ncbi:MAG: hypothetical protein ACRDY1_02440 [Acidimicrobiales bacterium]